MSYTHVYIEIKDVGMIFAYTHKYITYHFLIIYYITFTHIHIRIYIYYITTYTFSHLYIYTSSDPDDGTPWRVIAGNRIGGWQSQSNAC